MKLALVVTSATLAALLATEVTMQPTTVDRLVFAAIFALVAVVALIAARLLPRARLLAHSLHRAIAAVAIAAVVVATGTALLAAGLMFISGHDLRVILVALAFGVVVAIPLAVSVSETVAGDLDRLLQAVEQTGTGDFTARTGVKRVDRLGDVARAFDRLTAELAAARVERERADSARRAFLTAVGHDLRTPLTAIQAAVEALEDGVAAEPARYISAIGKDVDAMQRLVDDLFLMARIDAGVLDLEPIEIDLAEVADEAIEALIPVADSKSVVIALHAGTRRPVEGAPRELARAIRNLLDNAIRHAPPGSVVEVAVERSNGNTRLAVVDAGPGFTSQFAESASSSFTKADPARQRNGGGGGLGLAITRGLVEAHGGQLWLQVGPGGKAGFDLPTRPADGVLADAGVVADVE